MTVAIETIPIETIPIVGNWVEIIKPRKGRSYLVKGSTWLVESVNIDKQATKVNNGKTGESYKFEHLYFDEISPSSQFKKGDIVQHDEDARYIGRITLPGEKRVKIKWASGPEEYVSPTIISLFARMVKGDQQILREYAFKVGDKVKTSDVNHQGTIFTVRSCYPSGMVGLTSETEHEISLPGCGLTIVESVKPEPESDAPQPENYQNFEGFNAAYDKWLEELWKGDDDIAQVEEQFTSATELWEQYQFNLEISEAEEAKYKQQLWDWLQAQFDSPNQMSLSENGLNESEFVDKADEFLGVERQGIRAIAQDFYRNLPATKPLLEVLKGLDEAVDFVAVDVEIIESSEVSIDAEDTSWENFPAPESWTDWVDPRNVDLSAGTQTRTSESNNQIAIYSEKMQSNEWEWQREPLPELVKDGEIYYVVSGNHRIKAALLASKPDEETAAEPVLIYARIIPGTLEDAQLLAIRSNANDYHGVPESRADFRNRVNKFLGLLDAWDIETQVRELNNLKQQPYASEAVGAIDQLLAKLQQGTSEGWSNRIIAAYLRSPRSYRTIGNLLNSRQAETTFHSVKSSLNQGDWIQFENEGESQAGRISHLSATSIIVIKLDKTHLTINRESSMGLLQSIKRAKPVESETETSAPPSPPVKKSTGGGSGGGGGSGSSRPTSQSQELKQQATALGLPTSATQVLPDKVQDSNPYDTDDRLFASPPPSPEQLINEYLIAFVSNAKEMTQPQIKRALGSILEWMKINGQEKNLDCLTTVINDL